MCSLINKNMAYIKTLKDNELVGGTDQSDVYPVSSTQAIFSQKSDGTVPIGIKGNKVPRLEDRLSEMQDVITAMLPYDDVHLPTLTLAGMPASVEVGSVIQPTLTATFTKNGYPYAITDEESKIQFGMNYPAVDVTDNTVSTVISTTPDEVTVTVDFRAVASVTYADYTVQLRDKAGCGTVKTVEVTGDTLTAIKHCTVYRESFFNTNIPVPDTDGDGKINEQDVLNVVNNLNTDTIRQWEDRLGSNTGTKQVVLPEGAQLFAFAIPVGRTFTARPVGGFDVDWTDNFKKREGTVNIYGANQYTAVPYNIYYYSNYSGFKTSTTLKIIIQ